MLHHSNAPNPKPAEMSGRNLLAAPQAAEPGVHLEDLPIGASVVVETGHHTYRVENRGDGKTLIQGHPKYCPEPVEVELLGSTRGGMLPELGFIGVGMRMEFLHPALGMISTSRVIAIHQPVVS